MLWAGATGVEPACDVLCAVPLGQGSQPSELDCLESSSKQNPTDEVGFDASRSSSVRARGSSSQALQHLAAIRGCRWKPHDALGGSDGG